MGIAQKVGSIPKLIKLEYSIFVLPFTYMGMLFAGSFTIAQFLLITMALVSARGAAFAANRYIGLKHDRQNPKKREWVSINLYSKADLAVLFFSFSIVFVACAYLLNALAFLLAPLILIIIALEPIAKSFTEHRHMLMGFVIGLGIIGGYIGIAGRFPTGPARYVLLLAYMCFSASNDVVYSLSHVAFDKAHGLKTYPVKYGIGKGKKISLYLHLWASALFIEFGSIAGSPLVVLAGALTLPIFLLENRSLSRLDEKRISVAFFNYNAAVSLLMLASVIAFLYPHI